MTTLAAQTRTAPGVSPLAAAIAAPLLFLTGRSGP